MLDFNHENKSFIMLKNKKKIFEAEIFAQCFSLKSSTSTKIGKKRHQLLVKFLKGNKLWKDLEVLGTGLPYSGRIKRGTDSTMKKTRAKGRIHRKATSDHYLDKKEQKICNALGFKMKHVLPS